MSDLLFLQLLRDMLGDFDRCCTDQHWLLAGNTVLDIIDDRIVFFGVRDGDNGRFNNQTMTVKYSFDLRRSKAFAAYFNGIVGTSKDIIQTVFIDSREVTVLLAALLVGSLLIVPIVELLNSAVEAAIDRIGEDRHKLSGRAKDMGSAAVFISLWLVILTWGIIGY